jgi:O-antigen ligase
MPSHRTDFVRRSNRQVARFIHQIAQADAGAFEGSVLWAWMGLLAFGVLSFGAVEPWSLATFEIGSGVLLVWWLIAAMHRGKLRISLPPILLPAFMFFGYIVFQIIGRVTVYGFASKNSLFVFLACGICTFVGAQVLNSEESFRKFGIAASGFGFLIAALAIAQALTSPGEIYWTVVANSPDGVFGPYVNHSHYAGLMEMLIPFPFVLGRGRTLPHGLRGAAFIAAVVMVASVFMSASRGGIVAVVVELCVMYFLVYRRSEDEQHRRHGRQRWANVVSVIAAFGLVAFLGGQEMFSRISTLKDPYGNTVGATRIAIAKDCMTMFARHPFLGWGAGVFQEVYPAFRSFSTNLVVNAAHNDYLQLLVEFGLAGFAIAVCFLAVAFHRFKVLAENWKDSWPHAVSFAALLGAIGILVHSFTDFNLQVPANAALFYVMCAVASLRPSDPLANGGDEKLVKSDLPA